MKRNELADNLIDKNLLRKISPEEQNELKKLIISDEEVGVELEERSDIVQAVKINADKELKAMLNVIHNKIYAKKSKTKYAIAAITVLVIGALGYFGFQSLQPVDNEVLFAQYFENYDPSITARGENQLEIDLTNAFGAYKEQRYNDVLKYQGSIDEANSNKWRLILAISAIEMEETEIAFSNLDEILQTNEIFFIDHATWYKGLLLLKKGDVKAALELFEVLASQPGADHHNEAKLVLDKLK